MQLDFPSPGSTRNLRNWGLIYWTPFQNHLNLVAQMTNEELFFDALKSHRESKDIEISEICEFTKIHPRYIEAIESGDFNVLPTVYMRLFLRAYTDFIGVDSAKALEDFELHTTGKVQKRVDFEIKPTEDSGNLGEMKEKMASTSQVSPKQIATGAAVIIGLFLVLYWAGQITNQQKMWQGEHLNQ